MGRIVRDYQDEESHQNKLNCLATEDKDIAYTVVTIRELLSTKIKARIRHEKIQI